MLNGMPSEQVRHRRRNEAHPPHSHILLRNARRHVLRIEPHSLLLGLGRLFELLQGLVGLLVQSRGLGPRHCLRLRSFLFLGSWHLLLGRLSSGLVNLDSLLLLHVDNVLLVSAGARLFRILVVRDELERTDRSC